MGKNNKKKGKANSKRRGYEFNGYQNDKNQNFKLVANTERSALFQAKEGSVTIEYHYDKETGRKLIRRLDNPFV